MAAIIPAKSAWKLKPVGPAAMPINVPQKPLCSTVILPALVRAVSAQLTVTLSLPKMVGQKRSLSLLPARTELL